MSKLRVPAPFQMSERNATDPSHVTRVASATCVGGWLSGDQPSPFACCVSFFVSAACTSRRRIYTRRSRTHYPGYPEILAHARITRAQYFTRRSSHTCNPANDDVTAKARTMSEALRVSYVARPASDGGSARLRECIVVRRIDCRPFPSSWEGILL